MSDLISREKAIEDLQNGDPSELYDLEDIKYWLNSLPSAEPKIIRCKDCRRYNGRPCGLVNWYNGKEDFCSRATERGEQE